MATANSNGKQQRQTAKGKAMTMTINVEGSYPKVKLALEILADGTLANNVKIPQRWARRLGEVEAQLASFTNDEVETLAVGDYDEAAPLRKRAPLADRFLNWAFEYIAG